MKKSKTSQPTRKTKSKTNFKLVPLVKVINYNKIKNGDIIVIECEKGKENDFLAKANAELKSIIAEKDLRLLAMTPDFDMFSLKHVVEIIKDICENHSTEDHSE